MDRVVQPMGGAMVRRRMCRALVITVCLALAGCGGKSTSKSTQPNLGAKGTDT